MMPKGMNRNQVTSSRRSVATTISDPDNGILFLDNNDILKNPTNMKTPPPPMWGEVLEEDLYDNSQPFYDHELQMSLQQQREKRIQELLEQDRKIRDNPDGSRAIKRKIIYVYDDEDQNAKKPRGTSER